MKRILGPKPSEDTAISDAAGSSDSPTSQQQQTPPQSVPSSTSTLYKGQLPPLELSSILVPSLKVGATAGACGAFLGAAAGIIRSAPVILFSGVAGVQWFTLGTSYYGARQVGLHYFKHGEQPSPREKVKASAVAGGVAGSLGGLLRGPRNIIPGALVLSLLGAGGQAVINRREATAPAPKKEEPEPTPSNKWWSRWSPITRLSDEDYAGILEERILQLEADIALVDDRIKEIRESEKHAKDVASPGTSNGNPSTSSKS
ncbi:hypothetical protein VTJ83DRAFT_885 [Remersonia thermophila]|uniref:Uncharacterized protein n=1 Tax=Remersonia thermophila TaxID=72144 RepID=A0ABR4DPX5_9PEZI